MEYTCKFKLGKDCAVFDGTIINFSYSGQGMIIFAIIIASDGELYEVTLDNVSDVQSLHRHKFLKDMGLDEIIEDTWRFDRYPSQAILFEITHRTEMIDIIKEACLRINQEEAK